MKDNIELFNNLLIRFKFNEPASPEVRTHIARIKEKQFKKILKKTGKYSLLFGIIVNIFFFIKKLGINITIAKSAAILAVSVSVAAASAGSGVYYIVKYITESPRQTIEQIEEVPVPDKTDKIEKTRDSGILKKESKLYTPKPTPAPVNIENRIGIQEFTSENTEENLAHDVTDKISGELIRLRGNDYIINFRKTKELKKTGMILKGSVEYLNGAYKITAKVVDIKTLKILFYTAESFKNIDETDSACRNIAKRIHEAEKIPGVDEAD